LKIKYCIIFEKILHFLHKKLFFGKTIFKKKNQHFEIYIICVEAPKVVVWIFMKLEDSIVVHGGW